MPRYFMLILSLLTCGASTGSAQSAPDPKADLAVIEARAKTDPQLKQLLHQFKTGTEYAQKEGRDPRKILLRDMQEAMAHRFPYYNEFEYEFRPIQYRIEFQIRRARTRADFLHNIMSADLNEDCQVSREEVAIAVGRSFGNGIADVFIVGDANENGAVDLKEIQDAVTELTETRGNPDRSRTLLAPQLLDLDDDGILTQEEVNRSLAALTQ